ncbi:XTP/dITP diphosphatase [Candidatus Woesearchaeota archaeon]|nr:XTP/dITP diphosphatase [Candidatus Woesearchaeota archaeon]
MEKLKIYFVTHNKGKVREFKEIVKDEDIEIEHIDMEYAELRSDNPEEISKEAVKKLAEKLKKAVVVEDSGLFIKALRDFPGTSSAYIHKRIGLDGILKLMDGVEDRAALYKSAVGYCEPGKRPVSFLGSENGTIATEVRGSFGFGHDPIFIPEGFDQTYGEMENASEAKKFRRRAVEQLVKFLKK